MSDFAQARKNMVDSQVRTAGIILPGLLESFGNVPREKFVPAKLQGISYTDEDVPIGEGRYILEPITHARMVQAAAPRPEDVVLDIGGATGYAAAIMAPLVTTVIALEDKQKFLTLAKTYWDELEACNIVAVKGRLPKGYPEQAPYSLIFINGAVSEIPIQLVDQLAPQGRLVCIVKKPGAVMGQATLVQSLGDKRFASYNLFEAAAPYLPGFEPVPTFQF